MSFLSQQGPCLPKLIATAALMITSACPSGPQADADGAAPYAPGTFEDAGNGDGDGDGGGDGDGDGVPLNGETFFITQSWEQETDFARPVHVRIPEGDGPHPVIILLHGNGGNGSGLLNDVDYLPEHIRVAPDGYLNSWNLKNEASKAPDVALIRELIAHLKTHTNVDSENIALLGTSNGAGLVNRLLIELEADTFQHAVTIVSPLNDLQYRDDTFYYDPSGGNAYDTPKVPTTGRRICNISGTEDGAIPYSGGPGVAGYVFVAAEESIYAWARQMGEVSARLPSSEGVPRSHDPNLVEYTYLGGDVVHYKAIGAGHNAATIDSVRQVIAEFLGY